ncbi:MAG TPA: hypothetical protein VF727_03550 [Allosphingosinicella sp.]|jgi:hypothetical protein
MKAIIIGAVAVAAAFWFHGPLGQANVYAMSADEAYQKLAAVQVEPSGTGPFGRLDTTVSGSGTDTVIFTATGSHAYRRCTARVTPVDGKARVDASCDGGSAGSGAAAGLEINQTRKGFIELLDSTLDGRAYDPERAMGSTAARWPKDVVDHGDYGSAVADAVKMDADAHAMAAEQAAQQDSAAGGVTQ